MEADHCSGPLRRRADAQRNASAQMVGHRLGWKSNDDSITEDRASEQAVPRGAVVPGIAALPEAAFDEAPEGTLHVVSRYRENTQNLRTQFMRILKRAGIKPWERLFHNLRASRQTELADQFPLHVVTDWIGNSPDIADRHYLKTTDDHFEKAIQGLTAHERSDVTTQNPTQQAAESDRISVQKQNASSSEDEALLALASSCEHCTNDQIPPRGVEPRFSG